MRNVPVRLLLLCVNDARLSTVQRPVGSRMTMCETPPTAAPQLATPLACLYCKLLHGGH